MNKEQLLQEFSNKISSGEISYDEMMSRFNLTTNPVGVPTRQEASSNDLSKVKSNFSIIKMFYVLGAIIVVIGIILFTYQIWNDIGTLGRIFVTLGLGLVITAIGSYLSRIKSDQNIGTVFHFIGGLLIPGGVLVTISEFNAGNYPEWSVAIGFGIIFVFYLFLNSIHKNPILTFFTIGNGTVSIYSIVYAITSVSNYDYTNLYVYLTMVIGACYVLLAYSFRDSWNEKLVPILYLFGIVGIQIAVIYQYFTIFERDHSIWSTIVSLALVFIFYLLLNFKLKNVRLTLITIINGTALMYAFLNGITSLGSYYTYSELHSYLTMVIGCCYILLAHSFRNSWNSKLTEILNFFGALGLFSSAFSEIYDSLLWQLFFFILVIAGFVLSVYIRSRGVLILSTLFFIAYISYITSEYFADSVGWPISLVALGFIFIALGYMSITINKKYIK